MHPKEILHHVANQVGIHPSKVEQIAIHHLQKEGFSVVQQDDTLMFYKQMDQNRAAVHFITADKNLVLQSAVEKLLKQLKNHGINTIYLNTKNPKILTSLHISKADVVHGGGPQNTTRVHI